MNLLKNALFELVFIDTTGTALSTDSTSLAIVDTLGFSGVTYIGVVNTLTAAGDVGLELWHGDSSGTFYQCSTSSAGAFKITGTTADDESLIVLDVSAPTSRWHSIRVHRATQPVRVDVVAIKYRGGVVPTDNPTSTEANYRVAAETFVQAPSS